MCVCECVREKEREKERQTDRLTERDRDRQRDDKKHVVSTDQETSFGPFLIPKNFNRSPTGVHIIIDSVKKSPPKKPRHSL